MEHARAVDPMSRRQGGVGGSSHASPPTRQALATRKPTPNPPMEPRPPGPARTRYAYPGRSGEKSVFTSRSLDPAGQKEYKRPREANRSPGQLRAEPLARGGTLPTHPRPGRRPDATLRSPRGSVQAARHRLRRENDASYPRSSGGAWWVTSKQANPGRHVLPPLGPVCASWPRRFGPRLLPPGASFAPPAEWVNQGRRPQQCGLSTFRRGSRTPWGGPIGRGGSCLRS